jgi:predicted outer membrane repeat protein
MANSYSQLTIASCTLFQNSAGVQGGGIYNTLHSSPVIRNSILHENSPDNLTDQSGAGSDVSCSLVQGGWPGEGSIDADPLLKPLSDNGGGTQTCAIAGASPAYAIAKSAGGGDWNHAPDTDQRGVPRTFAGLRAMGAYEAPHAVLPGIYLLLF